MICIPAEAAILIIGLAIVALLGWRTSLHLRTAWDERDPCNEHGARRRSECLACKTRKE